jgi:hypothetical protein
MTYATAATARMEIDTFQKSGCPGSIHMRIELALPGSDPFSGVVEA